MKNPDIATVPPKDENPAEGQIMHTPQKSHSKPHPILNIIGVGVVKAITERLLKWISSEGTKWIDTMFSS